MNKFFVTLGQDLSAYATIEVMADTPPSKEELVEIANKSIENVVFNPDWSTASALRVASVTNQNNDYFTEDLAVEPSPYDAGQILQSFLRGYVGFDALVSSAAEAKLIDLLEMEMHRGRLNLPGAKTIEVEFECRNGAALEEKGMAFFKALAATGTVEYLGVGVAREAQKRLTRAERQRDELLAALEAALPALIRLGDFVENIDEGGASGLGRIDRCEAISKVRSAIAKARN